MWAMLVERSRSGRVSKRTRPDAINIPLNEIRRRIDELPRDREVWLYCGVGQRAYYATRVLIQNGFRVKNLPGGFRTYRFVTRSL
jgi:rhodanese-related sulfurtransferase